ncbi:8-oxo-dGTP diphosphatase [Myxococcota bacterium]|nr:8-oxo-dGTP diphosphatase [Myxococcota bacterium]
MSASSKPRSIGEIEWSAWRPVDRATLTFVLRDDQILLIRKKRGLGAGKINGPGGRLEPGETASDCAVREVQEELCITPLELTEWGELRFQFLDGYSIHVTVYRAEDFHGEPQETDEAIPLWFSVDEIPYAEMWADDVLWIPRMLAGERIGGRFLFDEDRMLDYALDEAHQGDG